MAAQSDKTRLDELRREIDAATADPLTPAVTDLVNRARPLVSNTTNRLRQPLDAASALVRNQPVLSIALVASVGWVLGRIRTTGKR